MPWQPAPGTQPLAPFDHQVAGQSSMLRYDKTTVCKPLIAREHFLYKTLPQELKEFTPEYRGEIEVQLIEEDGYIQLYGLCVNDETNEDRCSCSSAPGNHCRKQMEAAYKETSIKDRSTVRVLRSGSYEVSLSTDEVFYAAGSNPDHPNAHNLNPWSLKNHKRLLDKMRKSEYRDNKIRFILLKNVVADFLHPCILDLKIGSRLHGDDASSVKVASQSEKCRRTTSSTLGIRLCGMQVYQVDSSAYHSIDKYHGRTLNNESFRDMLYNFLHNGTRFRSELIQPIVSRLSQLIDCLEKLHSFRFYASSLLIIYDGDVALPAECQDVQTQLAASDNTDNLTSVTNVTERSRCFSESCQTVDRQSEKHAHCFSESCQTGDQQFEKHAHFFKERCQCLEEQPSESRHSFNQWATSIGKHPDEVCSNCGSISCSSSLHVCSCSQPVELEHNMFESSSANIVKDVQILNRESSSFSVSSHVEMDTHHPTVHESLLDTHHPTIHESLQDTHHPTVHESLQDTRHPTVHESLQQNSNFNLVQNVKEEHRSSSARNIASEETSGSLINHSIQQEQVETSLCSQEFQKICVLSDDASVEDNHHSATQKVPLNLQKVLSDTDSLSLANITSLVHRNSVQTHSTTDNFEHSTADNIEHSTADNIEHSTADNFEHSRTALNRIPEQFLNVGYSSAANDTISHVEKLQSITLTDLQNHEKTAIPPQSIHSVDDRESRSLSVMTESHDISQQTELTSFQEHQTQHGMSELFNLCPYKFNMDVKMIDFAHTTHKGFTDDAVEHTGADSDYILGLRNLIKLFQELQGKQ